MNHLSSWHKDTFAQIFSVGIDVYLTQGWGTSQKEHDFLNRAVYYLISPRPPARWLQAPTATHALRVWCLLFIWSPAPRGSALDKGENWFIGPRWREVAQMARSQSPAHWDITVNVTSRDGLWQAWGNVALGGAAETGYSKRVFGWKCPEAAWCSSKTIWLISVSFLCSWSKWGWVKMKKKRHKTNASQ